MHTVPGEHDVLEDDGKSYLNRYGKGTKGDGWYSFDAEGVHFIGLVNVVNLQGQRARQSRRTSSSSGCEDDVKHLTASTPIVVFAHVPLWIVYPDWGWGTEDGAQALAYLKKFGSVTVLNGHIHQIDAEGGRQRDVPHRALDRVSAAGARERRKVPGPMVVPAGELKQYLGIASVNLVSSKAPLAIVDTPLAG